MVDKRKLIEDLKSRVLALRTGKVSFDDKRVDLVEYRIVEVVNLVFGASSSHANAVENHKIWKGGYNVGDSGMVRQAKFDAGIDETIELLDAMLGDLPQGEPPVPA